MKELPVDLAFSSEHKGKHSSHGLMLGLLCVVLIIAGVIILTRNKEPAAQTTPLPSLAASSTPIRYGLQVPPGFSLKEEDEGQVRMDKIKADGSVEQMIVIDEHASSSYFVPSSLREHEAPVPGTMVIGGQTVASTIFYPAPESTEPLPGTIEFALVLKGERTYGIIVGADTPAQLEELHRILAETKL